MQEQSVSWVKELIAHRPLKREEAEAASAEYVLGARDDFEYFRQLMRPGMIVSWWTKEIARAMQKFHAGSGETDSEPSRGSWRPRAQRFGSLFDGN
jgi:hypothetical protein